MIDLCICGHRADLHTDRGCLKYFVETDGYCECLKYSKAGVVEQADTAALKAAEETHAGSTPAAGTNFLNFVSELKQAGLGSFVQADPLDRLTTTLVKEARSKFTDDIVLELFARGIIQVIRTQEK